MEIARLAAGSPTLSNMPGGKSNFTPRQSWIY